MPNKICSRDMQQERIPNRSWVSLFVLLFLTVLSFLDRSILSLLVEPIKHDLNISDIQIGLLQGFAFAIFYAGFGIPMGWLADRVSRRGLIYSGVTIWSLATTACGLAGNLIHLFVARLFVGMGEATLSPASLAMLPDLFPRRRLAIATGILGVGTGLGGAIALLLGGSIIRLMEEVGPVLLPVLGLIQPWQMVFIVIGLPGVLAAGLIFVVPRSASRPSRPSMSSTPAPRKFNLWLGEHWQYIAGLVGGLGGHCALATAIAAWVPTFLVRVHGFTISEAAFWLGMVQLVCLPIGFIGHGWLTDRLNAAGYRDVNHKLMAIVTGTLMVLGVAVFLTPDAVAFFVLYALFSAISPITAPAYSHIQANVPTEFRARILATVMAGMYIIGMVFGPLSTAVLTDKVFGRADMIGVSLALTIGVFAPIGTLCFIAGIRPARRLSNLSAEL